MKLPNATTTQHDDPDFIQVFPQDTDSLGSISLASSESSSQSLQFHRGDEWKKYLPDLTFPEINNEMKAWTIALLLIVVIILVLLFLMVLWMAF